MTRARALRYAGIGAGVAALGVLAWSFGPGAPLVVTWLADGREIWRLGRLDIEGVSGDHLGALRAARFTLTDEDGIWAEGRDVRLSWSPFSLLIGDIDVESVSAGELEIVRQPVLSAPEPPGAFQPDVDIRAMRVAHIHLAEPALGREAVLRFDGAMAMEDRDLARLVVDLARLDADTDHLSLRINAAPGELLAATARGAAGGLFATAMGVGNDAVRLDARATGDSESGEGALAAAIGEESLASGNARWGGRDWQAALTFNPGLAPVFAGVAERFGPAVNAEARGRRAEHGAQAFQLSARAANAELYAAGNLTHAWRIDGPVRANASIPDLNRLVPEFDLEADGGTAEGDVRFREDRIDFAGETRLMNLGQGVVRADAAGGFSFSWTARAADVDAQLALTPRGSPETRRLLANGRLDLRVVYDRRAEQTNVQRADLVSDALRIDAAGLIDDESGALDGRWQVMRLAAASLEISGQARGSWRMRRAGGAPWRIQADGLARDFRVRAAPLAQLIGPAPRIALEGAIADGGVRVERAVLNGARLRVGAQGLFADTLDMRVEASARGPVRVGNAEIAGAIDATGRMTGPLARPRLEAEAGMERFDFAGIAVDRPVLRFTYDFGARAGRGDVEGRVAGAAARAQAQVRATDSALEFSNLTAEALGLTATGEASLGADGPSLELAIAGPLSSLGADYSGRLEGDLRLTPAPHQPPRLALNARLTQAAFGDLRFAQATLAMTGPIDRLDARAQIRGASGATPINLDATASIVTENNRTIASLEARGALGGETLATRMPVRIEMADGRFEAEGSFTAGAGRADLSWESEGDRFAATARLARAELAPFAALAGQRAEGTASGELRVASATGGLSGAANLTVDGARLPARMRAPLDVRIDARLEPSRITGSLNARSDDGFEGAIEGSAPVETRASPLRIALADGGEGEASWRATGPADSLWSLVGGLDQSLGGNVEGQGRVRFNARTLMGAGHLALSNGRFEDRAAGFRFTDVDARLEFTEAGASRFTLSARDPEGGRLDGSGAARGLREGELALAMRRLRFIDREDVRATASGEIALAWTREGARLSGALTLDGADVTLAARADAIVPEIDVIEINRPGGDLPPARPRAPGPMAALDLRLTAPGRVFTRGRGLNAEWSLDARLQGTSAAPLVFGEARLIRGAFNLAGRPFDLERGRISLMGALDDATIDLLAERSEPELTARIAIGGLLFDPTITLSSDPALPEDEILPNILFGRAADDLSPIEGAQLAASLAALAGGAAFDIAGMARAAIGLDRFDVREDEAGVLVTGGRYLTRDVYLELSRTGLGEAGTRLEWRVRPQLSLVTSFLGNGDQRASVRWRRDY